MSRRTTTIGVAALSLAVVWLGVANWDEDDKGERIHVAESQESLLPPALALAAETPPIAVATETLSAKVERLTAEGKTHPAAALAAHQLVFNCVMLEQISKVGGQVKECDLPAWQRADRLRNLDIALKADVQGAGLAYFREGPAGDWNALESRPDDPLVVAWKKDAVHYLDRDARRGEIGAMDTMSEVYYRNSVMLPHGIAEPDDKLAAMWMEAWFMAAEIRKPSHAWTQKTRGELVARYAGDLSEQDIKAAKADAAQIIAQCCSSALPAGKESKP